MGQVKNEISLIAARLIVEDGSNYLYAKNKAREIVFQRTGIRARQKNLPNHLELELAVKKHLQLFFPEDYRSRLTDLRKKSITLMSKIILFKPLLIGSVASESVTRFSDIRICCFTETTKEIAIVLLNNGIDSQPRLFDHPLVNGKVEGLEFSWEGETTKIYALPPYISKSRLRGLNIDEINKLMGIQK